MESDSQTVPLDDVYLETVVLNDREYQCFAVENGTYFAPVDEVVGVDISPHMIPEETPGNLDLQIDDLNRPFTFPSNYFDLVHSRLVAGGINSDRWRDYLRDMVRVLRPGGWCQMVEIYFNAQSDNGSLTSSHALSRWSQRYLESLSPYKDPRIPLRLEQMMRQAGLVDVETRILPLPMCGWSSDPRSNDIGTANRENVQRLLASLATFPLTELAGMPIADVQLLVAQARAEASNVDFKVNTASIGQLLGIQIRLAARPC
ncbi:uncharacterized protein E0L32_004820 [Thyridium curvatum]|uniref:Methyltransferase type 11 domain-containing protein n=1 Tax=Thyridium curvatum TaxID=1093900 RepID=A0A507BEN1_9PEZI|nr:uncharacterized protein E0L32_004820 [Thyridium curvatum]TPX14990.1 hypothetical protein E0L32_004820 [Thyridium curvatum]